MQAQVSILILHLYILQALCIFEDYFFKFEHIISRLIVSIGTRAQQVQVVICTKAQRVIRAQVTSCKRLSGLWGLLFSFLYIQAQQVQSIFSNWGVAYRHQTLNVRVLFGLSYWKNTFRLNILCKVCQRIFYTIWTCHIMNIQIYLYTRLGKTDIEIDAI